MGLLLIVLGLVSAGLVGDFVVENHIGSAPTESFALLGGSVRLSTAEIALAAFVLGLATVLLLSAGMRLGRVRRGKRRELKRRVADFESENAKLRTTAPEPVHDEARLEEVPVAGRGKR